jgi:predicted small metal-binding protein
MVEASCPVEGCNYRTIGMSDEDLRTKLEEHCRVSHRMKKISEDIHPEFQRRR